MIFILFLYNAIIENMLVTKYDQLNTTLGGSKRSIGALYMSTSLVWINEWKIFSEKSQDKKGQKGLCFCTRWLIIMGTFGFYCRPIAFE